MPTTSMSSSDLSASRAQPSVRLTVQGADSTTELYLVDGSRRLTARGLGNIEVSVAPGLYTVRARIGSAGHDKIIIVPPGVGEHTEVVSPVEYRSAAPLTGATRTTSAHIHSAEMASEQTIVERGSGSQIFVYGRTPTELPAMAGFSVLKVLDEQGTEVVDVIAEEIRRRAAGVGEPGSASCGASVRPGAYRLRYAIPGRPDVEQSVIASAGWQTQVFLLTEAEGKSGWRPLPHVTVLTARKGFQAESSAARWAEAARQALAERRPRLAAELARQQEGFEDPMTGIYLLHLLVLAVAKRPKIDAVLGRLRGMVKGHPDVEIVAQHVGRRKATSTYYSPPMLRQSWTLLLAATVRHPELVPAESLSADIAPRLLSTEPWLVWSAAPSDRRLDAELKAAQKATSDFDDTGPIVRMARRQVRPEAADASYGAGAGRHRNVRTSGASSFRSASATMALLPPDGVTVGATTARRTPSKRGQEVAAKAEYAELVESLQLPRSTIEAMLSGKRTKR